MAKKINYAIFKKINGVNYPGEFWDEFKSYQELKKELRKCNYDMNVFRIVKIIYCSIDEK